MIWNFVDDMELSNCWKSVLIFPNLKLDALDFRKTCMTRKRSGIV